MASKESKFKMSSERYEELQKELQYLQTVREKEVSEQIKEARSFGDLSENSEYDEAKTEQGKLYSRIAEVKNLLENAEIIEKSKETGKINISSTVTVINLETKEEETYKIVGTQEANPMEGKISDESPIGSALIGRKKGETIEVDIPAGTLKFKIKSITK